MLEVQKVDHVGIRVSDKDRSIDFYENLGFTLLADAGFEKGHSVIMRHSSGVVINLLGPSNVAEGVNILMDVEDKHPGYTHMALRIASIERARKFLAENGIEITGSFSFKGMTAIFIRDPDRNVIELDEYAGDEPEARTGRESDFSGYSSHP